MEEQTSPMEIFKANVFEIYDLVKVWGVSSETILNLVECGVNTYNKLKMMEQSDINEIFNKRSLIGEKIIFRYHLNKWRIENKYEPLSCSASDRTFTNSTRTQEWVYTPELTNSDFNVKEILEKTVDGKDILTKYSAFNSLNELDQTSIVRIIVDHYIFHNIKLDAKSMENIAMSITKLFPTECEITYYVPRSKKKNASGKLYDRYYNQRNKRKHIETPASAKLCRTDDSVDDSPLDVSEFEAKKQWLAHNLPNDIQTQWKATSILRMKEDKESLASFLSDWPRYKDSSGYTLIDIDFETLYPGKGNLMFELMTGLENVMAERILPNYIKDKLNMQYLEKMKTATDTNSKHFYFFNVLHSLILPPRVNKTLKPSITDAQSDMIVLLFNIKDFIQKKDELREFAFEEESTIEPKIFVIGEDVNKLTEFYVTVNDLTYKVDTLLRAVDLVIKICLTFSLKYSAKSKYVWVFLQEYIFEIPSLEKIAKVQNILNKIKHVK